jgi:bifunctional UDP-N-acetylglucosamine pyrophosphorylase/glucosamine-1-phosphate N-acetyltransferase
MAAGRGSRMEGYSGNKALLPLMPGVDPFHGETPVLGEIIKRLPDGPKAIVVNHRKDDIIEATAAFDLRYCEQPELNGTGGALMAARDFIEEQGCPGIIISMGDVPFVSGSTYRALIEKLADNYMVVLGFRPESKKKYGVIETENGKVKRIIEWQYWKGFTEEKQGKLELCNSGIYAFRKESLLHYLDVLASRPHRVRKNIEGIPTEISEYFITDMVEFMVRDNRPVGYVVADDEEEVMGIDDVPALLKAQEIYRTKYA